MPSCEHKDLFVSTLNLQNAYKKHSKSAILEALNMTTLAKDGTKKAKPATKSSTREESMTYALELPVQEWKDEEDRNTVTSNRKTIYVVPPPSVSQSAALVNAWISPKTSGDTATSNARAKKRRHSSSANLQGDSEPESGFQSRHRISQPQTSDIVEYLQAFYHGLPVKVLHRPKLEFTNWEDRGNVKSAIPNVGLSTGSEVVRIRTRGSPDAVFPAQLHLDDLLDVAISILPKDAYALLMLVNEDIYEGKEDDFCCGRAYGGSRVAVVSTARYRPDLDDIQGLDELEHAWPGSHCLQYISTRFSAGANRIAERMQSKSSSEDRANSAVRAAVSASQQTSLSASPGELKLAWLSRVCKTASHVLGHCFGIDHCTYFACIMQGTASLAEDSRQPPYLCPVDLSKILQATGSNEKTRYAALLQFCQKRKADRTFAGFAAWIGARIESRDTFSFGK